MAESYRVVARDRFLTVEPVEGLVSIRHQGEDVAASHHAVALREGGRAPAYYLPREDVPQTVLHACATRYACRWKGEATYYDVMVAGQRVASGAWSYDSAPDDVAGIRGHVAFDSAQFTLELDGLPPGRSGDINPASA